MHIVFVDDELVSVNFFKSMVFSVKLVYQYHMSVVHFGRESALYGDVQIVSVRVKV